MGENLPSLQGLRKAASKHAQPGIDAAVEAALIVAFVQVGVAAGAGASWVSIAAAAIAAPIALVLCAAFVSGTLEAFSEGNKDAVAWPLVVLAFAWPWWAWLSSAWAVASLVGVALGSFVWSLRRHGNAKRKALTAAGLTDDLADELLALPRKLPKAVRKATDRALQARAGIRELATTELASDTAIDVAGLDRDADATLRQVVTRIAGWRKLRRLERGGKAAGEARAKIERELDALAKNLEDAHDAAVVYLAAGSADASKALAARTEHLHAVAEGLRELEADLDG